MDLVISFLKERSSQPTFNVYSQLENLLLKAANRDEIISVIENLNALYQEDINIELFTA